MFKFWYLSHVWALAFLLERFTVFQEIDNRQAFIFENGGLFSKILQNWYIKNLYEWDDTQFLTVPEVILKHGYPVEIHSVVSSDGYITTIHRIPHERNGVPSRNKPVVLLQHGLLLSSADWVFAGPDKSLGYLLADNGYDVWMSNNRGNRYSRNHTHLDTKSSTYWQFGWHEIAVYDTTATVDYILGKTGQESLFHVGHSLGTTVFYVMCAEKPEYNRKIRAHFSFGPVAHTKSLRSFTATVFYFGGGLIQKGIDFFGAHEISQSSIPKVVGRYLCQEGFWMRNLCSYFLISSGFSRGQLNITLILEYINHLGAGASMRQFMHYAQGLTTDEFRHWDFGIEGNFEKYGASTPPAYNLTLVTAPVYLYYSKKDAVAVVDDVRRLYSQLGNPKALILNADPHFEHMDYIAGNSVKELVYDFVMRSMENH